MTLEHSVLLALRQVLVEPDGPDVVAAGLVSDVVATGGVVRILIDLDLVPDRDADPLAAVLAPLVQRLAGVERVVVKPRPRPLARPGALPGVRHVLGVHSGKGGVGKSTLAANLAVAVARLGWRVGLLDADVYGPSAPRLLGLAGRVVEAGGGRIAPRQAHGLEVMSLGFLLPAEKALIWRGALVDEGLPQLFRDVAWGPLDLLVVDLPPGTSDVHLAVARTAGLSAVLTVTTPATVSIQDVQRGMEMFADIAVPCLGIVENMAGLSCRRCGHVEPLFGQGGGARLASLTGLPLLASIPFVPEVAAACDSGTPFVIGDADGAPARAVAGLAERIAARLLIGQTEAVA